MKPGVSLDTQVCLPRCAAREMEVWNVCSLVPRPWMSSTKPISGTGFMKCRPMTFSGRRVPAAKRVMEMELVLLARMACPGTMSSSRCSRLRFSSSRSGTASTT